MTTLRTNAGMFNFTDAEVETVKVLAKNILARCESATDDQLAEGRVWYAYAQDLAKSVTLSLRRKGYTVDFRTVAAVIAVTSNNMPWGRQIKVTEPIILAILNGIDPRELHLGVMGQPLDKAARVVNGDFDALHGAKVEVFYANIIGDYSKVTVDRHAVRVALGRYTDENETGRWVRPESRNRMMMEAAYYLAALAWGDEPAIVQAIAWTVYRYDPAYKVELELSKAAKRAARKAVK